MKFLAIASMLLFLSAKCAPLQCDESKVTNYKHICIQPQYIEGCYEYEAEQACYECEVGYQLNNKKGCDALEFQQREQKLQGCLIRDSQQKNTCLSCANGFINNSGKCQKGIKNCVLYQDKAAITKTCLQCKKDYSLILNQCMYNVLLGCKKMKSNHTCQICEPPFILKENHCQIQNCKQYNDYGCVSCECSFYLSRERICKKYQQGCIRYRKGRCINCLQHYRLKGGSCSIEGCIEYSGDRCNQCQSQYILEKGFCIIENCLDWINDQCLYCKKGFKNERGICKPEQIKQCLI